MGVKHNARLLDGFHILAVTQVNMIMNGEFIPVVPACSRLIGVHKILVYSRLSGAELMGKILQLVECS